MRILLLLLFLFSFNGLNAQRKKAYFASGCFWCVEAIFETIPGVINATSGYAGGTSLNPTYEQVCSGVSGYAETVEVTFNEKWLTSSKELMDYLLINFFDENNKMFHFTSKKDVWNVPSPSKKEGWIFGV